jgi:hypothetical protein
MPTQERRTEETGFQMTDTPYQIAAGLYNAIATTDESGSFVDTPFLYSRHMDMGIAVNELLGEVNDTERHDVFACVSDLSAQADQVADIFPESLGKPAAEAYGELVTSILWSFAAIKRNGGELALGSLPLRGDRHIAVGGFTMGTALQTAHELHDAVTIIAGAVSDNDAPVTRINDTGAYGMYRLGRNRNVIATLRLVGGTRYDPAIEYANSKGTEASIGYTVDMGKDVPSPFKDEQISPFTIRIDNEGDKLSLDVGSILGKPGTLGKRVADLIAIGDTERAKLMGESAQAGLNHNGKYFSSGSADPAEFAPIVAEYAAEFENRRLAIRSIRSSRLLLPEKISAA